MGRPRIGVSRRVVIPEDLLSDLRLVAAMEGTPVSVVIRTALRHYVTCRKADRRRAS